MLRFLAWRLLFLIPVLLGASAVVFTLIQLAPGDPIDVLMGVFASPEAREALRAKYGLDDPAWVQYFRWLGHILQGDWGVSIQQRRAVLPLVMEKFWITMLLTGAAGSLRNRRRGRGGGHRRGQAELAYGSADHAGLGVLAQHAGVLARAGLHLSVLGHPRLAADGRDALVHGREVQPGRARAHDHAGRRRRPHTGRDHRAGHPRRDAGGHAARLHDGAESQGTFGGGRSSSATRCATRYRRSST